MNSLDKKYQELIGDAYKNYRNKCKPDYGDGPDWMTRDIDFQWLTKEEFINKVKSDEVFSKRWEIQIEVRELEYEERWFLCYNETFDEWLDKNEKEGVFIIPSCALEDRWTEQGIPTKEIKVTYNGQTEIEYE